MHENMFVNLAPQTLFNITDDTHGINDTQISTCGNDDQCAVECALVTSTYRGNLVRLILRLLLLCFIDIAVYHFVDENV